MVKIYPTHIHELVESMIEFDIYQNHTRLVEIGFVNKTFSWDSVVNLYEVNGTLKKVYEWWSISERLCEQLTFHGEVVLANSCGIFWGRCATNQPIIMDEILQEIVMNMEDAI